MFSIYFKFLTLQIQLEPQLCGTNRETDAAVLSLNERFFSLSADSFVQLRFLLFPRLLIRPPALP